MPLIQHPTQRPKATKQVRDSPQNPKPTPRASGVIFVIFTQLARHKKKTALLAAAWIRSQARFPQQGRCMSYLPFS